MYVSQPMALFEAKRPSGFRDGYNTDRLALECLFLDLYDPRFVNGESLKRFESQQHGYGLLMPQNRCVLSMYSYETEVSFICGWRSYYKELWRCSSA